MVMDFDLVVPTGKIGHDELEGHVSATRQDDCQWMGIRDHNSSRLRGRLEVGCEPNCGIGAESKLINHLIPLAIDIPEVYWMISSG